MKKTRAFTLIELLVVIAIIAILAAIIFPVLAQAKSAAKKTADLSNIKQQVLAIIMYAADNDDMVVPVHTSPATFFVTYDWQQDYVWAQLVYPYVKSWDMVHNPADSQANDKVAVEQNWGADLTTVEDRERDFYVGIATSYGYNYMAWSPMNNPDAKWMPISMTYAGTPATAILLANSIWDKAAPRAPIGGGNWFVEAPHWAFSGTSWWFGGWQLDTPSSWLQYGGVFDFHNNTVANIGFGDGHAQAKQIPALLAGVVVNPDLSIAGVFDDGVYLWDRGE